MGIKAQAGIGSLILFIALVLVAATTAAVFIETSQNLQSKALATAGGSQKQVSTRAQIISAWGENASSTSTFSDVYLKLKLAPGSDAITLNSSYVSLATTANRQTYRFNLSSGCSAANLSDVANVAKFLVSKRIGYAKVGYLQDGDIIDVCARLTSNLSSDQMLTVAFTTIAGTSATFTTTTPSTMFDAKVQLYP